MALPSLLSAASGSAVIAAVSPVRRCEGMAFAPEGGSVLER